MNHASAKIIASSTANDTVVASAARISTTQGTALEIYEKSCEKENNASLIEKVVGSGHTSTLEHQIFTVAFDNVSVCTEEFVIEFRLGSYTVKSRRYVDFTDAGFCTPPLPEALLPEYTAHMQSLFDAYAKLLELEIPKEDARYLLPYCFRSNFYCTMNARELMYMVQVMTQGRGAAFPELKALGESLREQLCQFFPNIPDILAKRLPQSDARYAIPDLPLPAEPEIRKAETELCFVTPNAAEVLRDAAAFNGGILPGTPQLSEIIRGVRPRELEMLHAQFTIRDLSLAAITHLVRHRIQSVLVPQVTQAALRQHYVLPESVLLNAEACAIYQEAFAAHAEILRRMMRNGLPKEAVQYFALAGNQLDVRCDMNGRELLHFIKLRTCSRAQWEIRACAVDLLLQLRTASPEVFGLFGPSCFVTGKCPEGRLSCGKAADMQTFFSEMQQITELKQQMNLKLQFFEDQLPEAVGGGIYMISVRRKDGKEAPLYIGESYSMLTRCAQHFYEVCREPAYFGFTPQTISDSGLTLIAEVLETDPDSVSRKQKEIRHIAQKQPLSQSGIRDRMKPSDEKNAALERFLQA